VFLSILQKYIAGELLRVFLLALAALSFVIVIAVLVAEAAQQGLPPGNLVTLLPLLVPSTLPFTIPTAALFAVAVVYGRLAHDNEITAIKSAGMPVTRVLWPALALGAASSVVILLLYGEVIPRATHAFKQALVRDVEELLYAKLRRDLSFQTPGVNYAIFVKEVRDRRLLGATFHKRDAAGNLDFLAQAREAEIRVDAPRNTVSVRMRHGTMARGDGTVISIEDETFHVPLPPTMGSNRLVRAREMTNAELAREIDLLQNEATQLRAAITQKLGSFQHNEHLQTVNPENFQYHVLMRRLWEMQTEDAARPAVSAGCVFFMLLGCPIAIWFHRRDYLSAFVTCFLPVVTVYYPLMMFSMNLGKDGQADPRLLMWIADGVLGIAGLGLLWRLARH
jgi:lipopolysaccharide export system permease protein